MLAILLRECGDNTFPIIQQNIQFQLLSIEKIDTHLWIVDKWDSKCALWTESKCLAEHMKHLGLCLYITDYFILKVIYQMCDRSFKKLVILDKKSRTKNVVVYIGLFVV